MELKIETRNLDLRKGWQEKIESERDKLIRHYANLVLHLRVAIGSTSHHKEGGYEVKLVATVPNDTVVVKRTGEKVRPLLIEAFDVLGLQLKEMVRKRQNKKGEKPFTSPVEGNASGVVKRLYPFESYGFIATRDNQEVFFHENALKDISMEELSEGDGVSLSIVQGDKGPQASWVRAEK
ncbi:MAG: cold shock domain-containing protein [Desulfobulbaceae bacterium]|nr:cold shock domain-containing protein [Desulfobulbaceae bacterium]